MQPAMDNTTARNRNLWLIWKRRDRNNGYKIGVERIGGSVMENGTRRSSMAEE